MRSASKTLILLLAGLLLMAGFGGGSSPAAAQFRMGGFGRPVGFGRPAMGPWRYQMAPRWGAARFAYRPCGWNRNTVLEGCGRHYRIIGRGTPPNIGAQAYAQPRNGGNNGRRWIPPRGERHFVPGEVITEFLPSASPHAIERIAHRYNLTRLESQHFALLGSTLYRWRIGDRSSVTNVVDGLARERLIASAQPNYVFTLQEQLTKTPTQGDAAQYVLVKLQVEEAHRLATGKNILVAVIDSEIDARHPDLDGTIVKSFDALGSEADPHEHGTAMAGAIAAHGKLLGIAPDARILAARAFASAPSGAKGTSFAIYKSLQWAADNGARVVNMSFVGPTDPALQRMLAAAYGKDMVLIAAAGNAGSNSAPLYPAADPNVIAVTATDSNDSLFKMANRGHYIAVAAPGVDILAIAPHESYEITTGTSVAAAHVSGIAALLLECKTSLKASDVRMIIMATAKPLGSAGQHSEFGAGLANAYRAALLLNGKWAGETAAEQAKQ